MKVKDYLAGKKGICPTCGARFRIPLAAAPPVATAPAPQAGPALAVAATPAVATIVSLDAAAAVGFPELLLVAAATPGGLDGAAATDTPQVDPDPTADLQIEEDDAADVLYWYVAIPGGQPSAALREPDMLAWLDSGQATGREVVWRSDWPDWKPIGAAFPERWPPPFPGPGRR